MKAVIFEKYGSPQVIKIKDIKKPVVADNGVLIKVYASSVTTADTMIREGDPCFGRLFLGLRKHKKPVAGTGFAGKVEAIGSLVANFKVGDDVFGETGVDFGANAEYISLAENDVITLLPSTLSYAEAAPICDGALTSWVFLVEIAKLKKGQHILIIGAGGSLGTAAVQIAKHIGATVTGVCSTDKKEQLLQLGADHIIDYTQEKVIKKGQTYDVIFDTIGQSDFQLCKIALSDNGAYLSPVLSISLLFQMIKTSLFGSKKALFSAIGLKPAKELKMYLIEIKALFQLGHLKSIMDRRYPLVQASDAHKYVDIGHKTGNVILIMPIFDQN